ncbi:hypothetical protein GBV73_09635 [Thermococcus sp. 101 C5]|uniref:hypothetical protein n=1 Tax=unclassified Thermococcus TaxID=2627626 RepID=UPI0005B2C5E8|nr:MULTISPECIES: hypothetical protein [unclassified Thermococcus]MPW39918.1 hypothetical protein [Thermococcus sp. 101 C5]
MRLPLPIPREPTSERDYLKKNLETNYRATIATIRQGTWIASYLWTAHGWRDILKPRGFSWQMFMKAVRANSLSFLKWIQGEKTWEECIKDLINIIEIMLKY